MSSKYPNDQGQALLKRNANMTREQFSEAWKLHAQKVIPWALENDIHYYAQYHNPCLSATATANPPEGLKIEDWDGAAEMIFGPRDFTPPAKSQDYYEKVILVDERRFLLSEALKHLLRVDNGTIEGDVNVVIKDGKPLIEYDEYKKIWDEWVVEEKK